MGKQNFWALPDAWRAAFPPGLLVGVLVIGGLAVTESARGGLDRLFWVEASVSFPFVAVAATAILARRVRDAEPKD
jgi:hypothetical protein